MWFSSLSCCVFCLALPCLALRVAGSVFLLSAIFCLCFRWTPFFVLCWCFVLCASPSCLEVLVPSVPVSVVPGLFRVSLSFLLLESIDRSTDRSVDHRSPVRDPWSPFCPSYFLRTNFIQWFTSKLLCHVWRDSRGRGWPDTFSEHAFGCFLLIHLFVFVYGTRLGQRVGSALPVCTGVVV